MIEDFDVWQEERVKRTVDVPVPERDSKAPQMRPVRVFRTLRQVLGYDPVDDDIQSAIADDESVADTNGPSSAYEAGLLERMRTGELTEDERIRFGE